MLYILAINLIFILFRKSIAYVGLGPVFFLELLLAPLVLQTAFRVSLSKRLQVDTHLAIAVLLYVSALPCSLVLNGGAVGSTKDLVVAIYPTYLLLGYAFVASGPLENPPVILEKVAWLLKAAPILSTVSAAICGALGIELEMPNNTTWFAVGFLASVTALLRKPSPAAIALVLTNAGLLLWLDQRAALLNVVTAALIWLCIAIWRGQLTSLRRVFQIAAYGAVVVTLLVLSSIMFPDALSHTRYESLERVSESFLSIFGLSEVGAGTREHRLIMWATTWQIWISGDVLNLLFGQGFLQQVSDTDFRSIHNGYLTILFRTGIFGLGSFLALSWVVGHAVVTRGALKERPEIFFLWTTMLLDAVTGTVLDSPFTSGPVYLLVGGLLAISHQTPHPPQTNR